jgi:hypothetical protein
MRADDSSLSRRDESSESSAGFFSALSDFGRSWDSGRSRLGNHGTQRRQSAMSEPATASPPESPTSHTDTAIDSFLQWYAAEKQAEQAPDPLRPYETYPDEIDPHRVVLFSDIQSLLFPVQTSKSLQHLTFAFLRMLGADNLSTSSSAFRNNDPYLVPTNIGDLMRPALLPSKQARQTTANPSRQLEDQRPGDSPVKCWSTTRNTLIDIEWFSEFDARSIGHHDLPMIRYVRQRYTVI